MPAKRSGKWYRNNEAQVMRRLGLRPTKGSGCGWIEKEDGQSENVLCQLKSTDASSIRITKQDIDTLEYNALVAHKVPVFAFQFIETDDLFLVVRADAIGQLAEYLKTGKAPMLDVSDVIDGVEYKAQRPVAKIRSSSGARQILDVEHKQRFAKRIKSAT